MPMEEAAHLRSQRDLLLSRVEQEGSGGPPPITMSAAALSTEHLESFERKVKDASFRYSKRVQDLRDAALTTPRPISEPRMRAIGAHDVWARPNPPMPAWASLVARNRGLFERVVLLAIPRTGEKYFFKVLYAVQSPVYVALTPLREEEVFVHTERWPGSDAPLETPRHKWHCNFASMSHAGHVPETREGNICVFPDSVYAGKMVVVSDAFPIRLSDYVYGALEERGAKPPTTREKVKDDKYEELLMSFPWLEHLDAKEGYGGGAKKTDPSSSTLPEEDAGAGEGEDDLVTWMAKLDEARAALAEAPAPSTDDFRTTVLGGHDAIQGIARTAIAKDFCRRRGIQGCAVRYNLAAYGDVACGILARAWCNRMQYYFNIEVLSFDGAATIFSEADHAAYAEPSEFVRLLEGDVRPALMARVRQIRALMR